VGIASRTVYLEHVHEVHQRMNSKKKSLVNDVLPAYHI